MAGGNIRSYLLLWNKQTDLSLVYEPTVPPERLDAQEQQRCSIRQISWFVTVKTCRGVRGGVKPRRFIFGGTGAIFWKVFGAVPQTRRNQLPLRLEVSPRGLEGKNFLTGSAG